MTLCDAGPLIALVNRRQAVHQRCADILNTTELPLMTTWACLTEAMYMVGVRGGWAYQRALWSILNDGLLQIHPLDDAEVRRAQEMMGQYANVPMDLADATLVAIAEKLQVTRVFTLDSDFRIYRMGDGKAFEIQPM